MSRNEGLKYREIAELLGISVNAVDQHIRKALRILKEKLPIVVFLSVAYQLLKKH